MDWNDEMQLIGITMEEAAKGIIGLIRAMEECEDRINPKLKQIKHLAFHHRKKRIRKKNLKRLEKIRNYLYR